MLIAKNNQGFSAGARFQRVSPQKARLVLELIRGRRVEEALQVMAFTKKAVAPLVTKVLRSALQNATYLAQERGLDVDVDSLYVTSAIANDGPRLKRIRPAPMGRAFRYQRRTSHIEITVGLLEESAGVGAAETGEEKRVKQGRSTAGKSAKTLSRTDLDSKVKRKSLR